MEDILYDSIGNNYNLKRSADPLITSKLYNSVYTDADGLYMDIGCGTGNYTIAISKMGMNILGIDPSEKMLKSAKEKSSDILWLEGKAENLPVKDNQFSGIFGTLTLHHWKDLEKGFIELFRVLKKDTHVVFFTSTSEQMEGYWLNHYFPNMLSESIRQMPSLEKINQAALQAGFELLPSEKYFVHKDLKDHFLYVGKHNPELYFDEDIRNGISSFAALSNVDEVAEGLVRLKSDIEDNTFSLVKDRYKNDYGDYLFVKFKKKS